MVIQNHFGVKVKLRKGLKVGYVHFTSDYYTQDSKIKLEASQVWTN